MTNTQEAMKQATEFFWLCELMEQDSHYHHGLPKYIAAKGRFELTADPYKAARFADEELCRAVCTAAHTQGHLYVKPVEHGFITTLRAALAASQPEPCQAIGRHDPHCENRHQCWEPCGELGKSEEHAKVASQPEPKAGEPEVVAWMREGWGPDCGHYVEYRETAPDWKPEEWAELITLSAHREAMAKLEAMLVQQAEVNAKMTRDKYPFVHIRMDASEAEKESALRAKLIELGWGTPEALAKKDAALDACVEALERVEPQFGYGFYRPENPHDFHPDPESCSPEEITNHKAACEAYDAGTYSPDNSDGWVTPDLHITKAPWGIGSYEVRDPLIDAAIAQAKKARGV